MILKILMKIWPGFVPILTYIFWLMIQNMVQNYLKKKNYIEGEFEELDKNGKKINKKTEPFSIKNPRFIFVIYLSLIFLIISFLFFAITSPGGKGQYVPAQNKNGKIIPAYINQD